MTIVHNQKILDKVAKLYAQAKDGSLKIDDETYTITFHRTEGVYYVVDASNNLIARFNTRKLTQAKQWLKEWFAN